MRTLSTIADELAVTREQALAALADCDIVHVVAGMPGWFRNTTTWQERIMVQTITTSRGRGAQVVVVADRPDDSLAATLEAAGAVVLDTPPLNMVRQQIVGALVVGTFAPDVPIVFSRIDQAVGGDEQFFAAMLEELATRPFVFVERSIGVLRQMSAVYYKIARLLIDVARDASDQWPTPDVFSGIYGLTGPALRLFKQFGVGDPNDPAYFLAVALQLQKTGSVIGKVTADYRQLLTLDEDRPITHLFRLVSALSMIHKLQQFARPGELSLISAIELWHDSDLHELVETIALDDQLAMTDGGGRLFDLVMRAGGMAGLVGVIRCNERAGGSQVLARLVELYEQIGDLEELAAVVKLAKSGRLRQLLAEDATTEMPPAAAS